MELFDINEITGNFVKLVIKRNSEEKKETLIRESHIKNFQDACKHGKLYVIKNILNKNILDTISFPDKSGYHPIHIASLSGHLPIVKFLLERDIPINQLDEKLCETPLHKACENNHPKLIKFLLDNGADPSIGNRYGTFPIGASIINGNIEIFTTLLSLFQPPKDKYGDTLLHNACYYGNFDIAEFLIRERNADPTLPNKRGITPLQMAQRKSHTPIVRLITDGDSLFHYACSIGDLDLVESLTRSKKANPALPNKRGITPLQLLEQRPVIEYLLFHACSTGDLASAKFLIREKNANPVLPSKSMNITPLQMAEQYSHGPIVEFIINEFGNLLFRACSTGDLATAKYLIRERNVDPTLPNSDGISPIGITEKNSPIYRLIIEESYGKDTDSLFGDDSDNESDIIDTCDKSLPDLCEYNCDSDGGDSGGDD